MTSETVFYPCAGQTIQGRACSREGWLPFEGRYYCALHDPRREERTWEELEVARAEARPRWQARHQAWVAAAAKRKRREANAR